jgi:two-component system, NarL family, sensor histidine kinase UhpB
MLQHVGLETSIKSLCMDFEKQHGSKIVCKVSGLPTRMGAALDLCFYRVLQECLSNIARHSQARNICVEMSATATDLAMDIIDDGIGFDSAKADTSEGLGLVSMRERANLVKGSLSIVSEPGKGTQISLRAPRFPDSSTKT